jgi:hypothetical protein
LLIERSKAGVREIGGLLSRFEKEAEEVKKQVGEAVMSKKLSDLSVEDGQPKKCPICGKEARVRKKAVPRTFKTLSDSHTVTRNQHYCENRALSAKGLSGQHYRHRIEQLRRREEIVSHGNVFDDRDEPTTAPYRITVDDLPPEPVTAKTDSRQTLFER